MFSDGCNLLPAVRNLNMEATVSYEMLVSLSERGFSFHKSVNESSSCELASLLKCFEFEHHTIGRLTDILDIIHCPVLAYFPTLENNKKC
jgi:hypothetical protein